MNYLTARRGFGAVANVALFFFATEPGELSLPGWVHTKERSVFVPARPLPEFRAALIEALIYVGLLASHVESISFGRLQLDPKERWITTWRPISAAPGIPITGFQPGERTEPETLHLDRDGMAWCRRSAWSVLEPSITRFRGHPRACKMCLDMHDTAAQRRRERKEEHHPREGRGA